jgi:hypothetical protein
VVTDVVTETNDFENKITDGTTTLSFCKRMENENSGNKWPTKWPTKSPKWEVGMIHNENMTNGTKWQMKRGKLGNREINTGRKMAHHQRSGAFAQQGMAVLRYDRH